MQSQTPSADMAIAIKSIPTLENQAAQSFVKKAESSVQKRGTVDFSKQIKSASNILAKAQLK
ncbi:MAG: hypothetical protein RLP11_02470 [Marinoscillum sp.]|uniref:hypothetical protein n=2 Tax=Marinoscillum sp. TaxID=2024838 RepID=UPI0032FBE403